MNKNLICLAAFSGMLLTTGCSENETPEPVDNTPVELQVSPQVTLTRSVIDGGSQTGTGATIMQNIAVYAQSTTTNTAAKNNNYAIYTLSSGSWTNSSATDKILLSSEDAKVYAYYPAYQPGTNNEYATTAALKLSGDADATSTIPITVYEGGAGTAADYTITPRDNAEKTWQTSSWANNATPANVKLIAAAPGEVDYMWATSDPTEVDNGRGSGAKGLTATLTMNHALALVSFRIYNDGSYQHEGKLTKIKLENVSGSTILSKAANHTMKITDGTIANGTATAATYTRLVSDYTLITVATPASATAATSAADAAAASKKLSMLVLPASSVSADQVKATFTIDGADYDVKLTAPTGAQSWDQGKNYLYTVKLSGQSLSIGTVTVTDWTEEKVTGDLEIK